ncbi:MAG: hypothetical protein J7J92_01270 [Candidatus Aenigmarchaeota archaeon]|nr:hypothetical protein [Candidatus Aenigmarchaeota archaeon]
MGNYDLKYVRRAMKESSEIQRSTRGQAILDRQNRLISKSPEIKKIKKNAVSLNRANFVMNILGKNLNPGLLSYFERVSKQLTDSFFYLDSDLDERMTIDLKIPVSQDANVKRVDYGKNAKLNNLEIYKDEDMNAIGIKYRMPLTKDQNFETSISLVKKFADTVNIVYELLEENYRLMCQ